MLWWFRFVLVAHLLGVFLLVAAMALQATLAFLTRQAASPDELRRMLPMSRWVPRLFAPATWLIVVSGIYMSVILAVAGERWGWMAVAFVALVALAVWGKTSGKRRNKGLARLAAASGGEMSPELQAALHDPAALVHVALGIWVVAGIVVLMVYEPGVWIAIAVMVAALILTAVVRILVHQRRATASAIEGV